MQIVVALTPNAQNKYLWDPKNIGLNFTFGQYFQGETWTFSWTYLKKFLSWSFSEMISEAFTCPHFKFIEIKHDAHMTS